MYVPEGLQAPDFCSFYTPCGTKSATGAYYPCTECNWDFGIGFGKGSFHWARGAWNRVRLTVRLNTVGRADGFIQVDHNGQTAIQYDKVVYRTSNGALRSD
jgi:hypothetical protein